MKLQNIKSTKLKTILLVLLDIFLWTLLSATLYFTSPETQLGTILFFTSLFSATLLLIYLTLKHKRHALLITLAITGLLALRFYNLDQWYNTLMLIGLLIATELLFVIE